MMREAGLLLSAALLASFGGAPWAYAELLVSPGFSTEFTDVGASSVYPSGVDLLPNGHAVLFDGDALVEVDVDSQTIVGVLFQPSVPVFGSFVRVAPDGGSVVFGESSQHHIWQVPLTGGVPQVVATVEFNYAATFLDAGRLLISHAQPGWQNTDIVALDLHSGAIDGIATVPGASGPLAFDRFGTLHYGVNPAVYPAPPASGSVISWTAAQIAGAIGPAVLGEVDAASVLVGLSAVSDLAFDEEGDLIVSDSIAATVVEYDVESGFAQGVIAVENVGSSYVTSLAFVGNGAGAPAQFQPFQPEDGGTLLVVATDFISYARVHTVKPRRVPLTVDPSPVVPVGPFALGIAEGPPFGQVLLFASAAYSGPGVNVVHQGVPLLFELHVPTLLFVAHAFLSNSGALLVPAWNSGQTPGSASLQGVLLGPGGDALGTTGPLTLTLQ